MRWWVGLLLGVIVGAALYGSYQRYLLDAKNAQG